MRASVVAALGFVAALELAAAPEDAVIGEARALLSSGRAEAAALLLERAVADRPDDARRHYWLARAYGESARGAGMFRMLSLARKAGAGFERAVALDPDLLAARFALMDFQLMAPGMLGGGIEAAREQAQEIRRRDAVAGHRAFAALAVARKDLAGARAEHLAALRDHPLSPVARYDFGVFLMVETREYAAAGEQLAESLRLDPGFLPAYFQLGHLAALSGVDLERGAEALLEYLAQPLADDAPPLHRARYWLARIYERQGRTADARAQLESALRLRPGDEESKAALERLP